MLGTRSTNNDLRERISKELHQKGEEQGSYED